MSTIGKLTLDEGLIGVSVSTGAFIDAAVNDQLAGIEIAVTNVNVTIGPRSDYRAPLTLSIDLHPSQMMTLALTLLEKLGTPAFNEREWRLISDALRDVWPVLIADGNAGRAEEIHKIASQIERAYHPDARMTT
jgi:hypothetical protein